MPSLSGDAPVIAIIGGGVSGAAVAYHLARTDVFQPQHIVVFEPRSLLGAGLAYDSSEPAHRINVPSTRMSLLPDDPEHFQRWIDANDALADDDAARAADGALFPRRSLFGTYMNRMVRPHVDSGAIRHVRSRLVAAERRNGRWHLTDAGGATLAADILVVATSHPAPSAPAPLVNILASHPRFVADPTRPNALDAIGAQDRVLVVGNGLTSADVVAALSLKGHIGSITGISRRGLRSRGHAPGPQEPFGDFASQPAATASGLLRQVRAAIRAAAAEGLSWHAVIDQVRGQGEALWQALPIVERRRIARHLRPFWDVHRFRVAPQVEAVSEEAIAAGRMEILAASVAEVAVTDDAIAVTLRLSRSHRLLQRHFDAVVVTTGPGHGGILRSQPFLTRLAEQGLLRLDPTGLGLDCNEASQAVGDLGLASPSLFISGPLARGTFGELMGLPQVTEHAVLVAQNVVAEVLSMFPALAREHRL
jgi:uncharacterized NAD(P)/FAD-binding protein YdhS